MLESNFNLCLKGFSKKTCIKNDQMIKYKYNYLTMILVPTTFKRMSFHQPSIYRSAIIEYWESCQGCTCKRFQYATKCTSKILRWKVQYWNLLFKVERGVKIVSSHEN